MAEAISSLYPGRAMGIMGRRTDAASTGVEKFIGVAVSPGATPLTLTP